MADPSGDGNPKTVTSGGATPSGIEPEDNDQDAPLPGAELGPYRLTKLLGVGGMGRVYEAEHTKLGRVVALKVLKKRLTADRAAVRRFFGEARTVNQVKHPSLVEITDFLELPDGDCCCVMELLHGETLSALLKHGPLPLARTCNIGVQLASALAAVHHVGVVHRDLKPDNVFLVAPEGDHVKLLDFGVAKLSPEVLGKQVGDNVTQAGAILGTPAYMAPEQLQGESVDARSDIYSLGVNLYEMYAGTRPFSADTIGKMILNHMLEPVPPWSSRGVPDPPPAFDELVRWCMQKDPARRPASMADVEQHLRTILAGNTASLPGAAAALAASPATAATSAAPRRARGRGLAAAAAAAAVFGVVVVAVLVGVARGDAASDATAPSTGSAPDATPPAVTPGVEPVAAPAMVTLRFSSEPSGANVRREGSDVVLGVTPFSATFAREGGRARFEFELQGRPPTWGELTLDVDGQLSLVLPPQQPDGARGGRRRGTKTPAAPVGSPAGKPAEEGARAGDRATILDPFGK